ncbi:glycyl-tRNA synthetase subunit beta [Klebsiella pneumoniae]|uniref:Glycine--tRNA ligase beta subunit n=1 Tax=Klebsiella pneumoniae TaxID=573 RepID=A0A378B853_KLEPN|nr:glycyl-tRNA synthetase subunit beta [Klebsiella pneumoniae]
MSENTFLVEIGTEELPPKALRSLAESFAANVTAELDNAGLAHGKVEWFAAPRRLALKVANLAAAQADREVEKRGPAIAQAFDAEGKPSKAAEGWARGCGITVDQAERLTTDKGEWLLYRAHVKGESTEALLPNMIASSLAKLPIPKLMRWGASDVHFVRPVHTVTLLLGDKVIPATILGIPSDRVIRGHRFMGEPEFTIDHADQYPQILLERGKVIADYEQRKAKIKADAQEAARKIGGQADLSESLLEEVTSLVEWPVVLTAKFEEKFLAVPSEALVYTMKGDQKYFRSTTTPANCCRTLSSWPTSSPKIRSRSSPVTRRWSVRVWPMLNSSSTPTVKNVWKITCRVWKPCCSNSNLGPCATRPIASRRWRAGLPNRLALT